MSEESTWQQDHFVELVTTDAHIAQKLAQLDAMVTLLKKLATELRQLIDWLHPMYRNAATGDLHPVLDYFSPETFVRLASVGLFLGQNVEGLTSAGQGSAPDPNATARHAFQTAQIFDAAGPLGTQVKLSEFTDQFGITRNLDDEGYAYTLGASLWGAVTSPFTTYQEFKFTFNALDTMSGLLNDHGDKFQTLANSVGDAVRAVEAIEGAIERADLGDPTSVLGGRGMTELQGVRDTMAETYGAAGGAGPAFDPNAVTTAPVANPFADLGPGIGFGSANDAVAAGATAFADGQGWSIEPVDPTVMGFAPFNPAGP